MKLIKNLAFVDFFLLISVVLIGGFNEYISCVLSAVFSIYLLLKVFKNKNVTIKINILTASIALICFMYGLTTLWAIDRGMAFIGFLKFLPVGLFLISTWQTEQINYESILPYFAAAITLVSMVGMNISFTSSFFSVAGRLAGFFQYPNTFALFLLVCELILLQKPKLNILDYICLAVLMVGLLYTGSRTVFIFAILSNLISLVYKFRNGFKKRSSLIVMGIFLIGVAVVFLLNVDVFKRYLSISVFESTFVGRILYWVDALPLLLKHPFGMGFLGYKYVQSSIQTGLYTVRFVHNDFLQLFLDIGWVPAILFIVAIIKFLFKKDVSFYKKITVATICAHSFFDFNLQFVAIWFILVVLTNDLDGKMVSIKRCEISGFALTTVAILNMYMGTHLALSYFKQYNAAESLYPWNTDNKIAMLEMETDIDRANIIADKILKQNEYLYMPYSVKAKYAYSQGAFNSVIENKKIVFEKNPFEYTEYEEYCKMLINGIYLYQRSGDMESAKYCQKELINTKNRLGGNINRLSYLGKLIKDQPQTELPQEILDYIDEFEEGIGND